MKRILPKSIDTKWIYGLVMVYLTLAFGWWAYMLMQHNNNELKNNLFHLSIQKELPLDSEAFKSSPEYAFHIDEFNGNYWQIISEGIVFVLTLKKRTTKSSTIGPSGWCTYRNRTTQYPCQ